MKRKNRKLLPIAVINLLKVPECQPHDDNENADELKKTRRSFDDEIIRESK